ncbi:MAG: DUF1015 domain-containing protein [Candidatus Omnitrophica bacterium]|nr:DUF1015 domain-containing protein [Candidatus Omnitrophota bacterium]
MAQIKPFKAVIYNQDKIKDLSKVVCPPYDVISPERQQYFHDLHPNNLIHVLLPKAAPQEDKYRIAGSYFKDWLKNRILIPEDKEAIYFYSQQYNLKGEKRTRLGFIARLYLEEKKSTFGHEHTHQEAKEDRLKLLKKVKANLSPVFVIFSDKKRIIQSIYQKYIKENKPFVEITDDEKVTHKLWRIDSPEILRDMENKMSGESIFIADGHHRYEVACAWRDEIKKKMGSYTGKESFNYLLAYFTNTDPRGLTILPIHRLVKLSYPIDPSSLIDKLIEFFAIEEVKDRSRFFFLMEKAGKTEHILGMYHNKRYSLLRLKNVKILDKIINDKPQDYRSLDVCILNYIILKDILGLDLNNKEQIAFSPHAQELIEKTDSQNGLIAFFLNPVKIQQIISVALSGNKMPPKSTYFYPKVLSGLAISRHEEPLT